MLLAGASVALENLIYVSRSVACQFSRIYRLFLTGVDSLPLLNSNLTKKETFLALLSFMPLMCQPFSCCLIVHFHGIKCLSFSPHLVFAPAVTGRNSQTPPEFVLIAKITTAQMPENTRVSVASSHPWDQSEFHV